MASVSDVRGGSAPLFGGGAGDFVRWVCTRNPFYAISAALFLAGLYISFGGQGGDVENWALMSGLGGYTLLLAGTALLLVRFARVWDDARTVLLLVVLMFLATSVTFDEVLAVEPGRGFIFYLVGLVFAVLVSEAILRGVRLRLPAGFRVPYYLVLGLFFLYPLALTPFVDQPHSEALMWGLFGFSAVAGVVFLTLLPAIRRGPDYTRDNGSPWPWPLYPWSLFAFLAFAVPCRAFLLCWSMHYTGMADFERLIFGPYFVVPFGLAVAVLLLEIGLVQRATAAGESSNARGEGRVALATAIALPILLIALSLIGHRDDPYYREFLTLFTGRLGGDPLYLTLLASAVFYGYAAIRRVRPTIEGLTAMLAALAFVGPRTLADGILVSPQPAPILMAAVLQLTLGIWKRESWRCLLAAAGLVLVATLAVPADRVIEPLRWLVAFHLGLLAVLIVAAALDDVLARLLRIAGPLLVLFACLTATFAGLEVPRGIPAWPFAVYPALMAVLLVAYGLLLGQRFASLTAGVAASCWLANACWRGYHILRQFIAGLDYLALSLALFVVGVGISLAKSRMLGRRPQKRVDAAS